MSQISWSPEFHFNIVQIELSRFCCRTGGVGQESQTQWRKQREGLGGRVQTLIADTEKLCVTNCSLHSFKIMPNTAEIANVVVDLPFNALSHDDH